MFLSYINQEVYTNFEIVSLTEEAMNEFLDHFVSALPDYFKAKISISSCES